MKAKLGPEHPMLLETLSGLAACYADLGRNAEALRLREEVLAVRKTKLGPDHPDTRQAQRGHRFPTSSVRSAAGRRWLPNRGRGLGASQGQRRGQPVVRRPPASRHQPVQAKAAGPDAAKIATEDADKAMAWLVKAVAAGS